MPYRGMTDFWTESAIDCYNRGCNCKGCLLNDVLESGCVMKRTVSELVKKLGKPKEKVIAIFSPAEQEFIDKILEGSNSFEEVGEKINKKTSTVATIAHRVYNKARKYYGWKPIKKGLITKSLLPQFINWVRNGTKNKAFKHWLESEVRE